MNVNLNSLQRTSQNQDSQEIQKPVKGDLKGFKVTVGEAKPKTDESPKTFFSTLKTAISSRIATIKEFFKSIGDRSLDPAQKLIAKATTEQLRTGDIPGLEQALKSQPDSELAKLFNNREAEPEKFLKKVHSEFGCVAVHKDDKLKLDRLETAVCDLRVLMEETIGNQPNPGTILRGNTADTAFQRALFKTVGGDYTVAILKPVLNELKTAGKLELDPHNIEVDPKTLRQDETVKDRKQEIIQGNAQKLGQIYQKLMDNLAGSVDRMPKEMRDACALIYTTIRKAGGDEATARNGACASIVLRLLNPALTSPDKNAPDKGSLPKFANEDHKRAAILLSKLFQNQANCVLDFNGKTQFMQPMESKLQENDRKLQDFLKQVISNGNVPEDLTPYLPEKVNFDTGYAKEQFANFHREHLDRELAFELQDIDDPIDEEIVLKEPNSKVQSPSVSKTNGHEDEFVRTVKENVEDLKNEALIEEINDQVGTKEENEVFNAINQDGRGFQEENAEIKDLNATFQNQIKEEDKLMNELLGMNKN